jgi:hypothetical protein
MPRREKGPRTGQPAAMAVYSRGNSAMGSMELNFI